MGMPFLIVFGALSDKVGRKKIMMAGFLLGVLTYVPIYHAMERAAGNHVVTVKSTRSEVTGAITLTPMTTDATGGRVAASEAIHTNKDKLSLLMLLRRSDCGRVYVRIAG